MIALLASAQLLTCSEFSWLAEGVWKLNHLSVSERLEIVFLYLDSTNPTCFSGKGDAND